jgi:hypothetical protein
MGVTGKGGGSLWSTKGWSTKGVPFLSLSQWDNDSPSILGLCGGVTPRWCVRNSSQSPVLHCPPEKDGVFSRPPFIARGSGEGVITTNPGPLVTASPSTCQAGSTHLPPVTLPRGSRPARAGGFYSSPDPEGAQRLSPCSHTCSLPPAASRLCRSFPNPTSFLEQPSFQMPSKFQCKEPQGSKKEATCPSCGGRLCLSLSLTNQETCAKHTHFTEGQIDSAR